MQTLVKMQLLKTKATNLLNNHKQCPKQNMNKQV